MLHKGRSMLGVTLLEIMLVLAIAGMIIVMSVRYYQAASISSQTNAIIQQIVGIIAAEESLAQGGNYGDTTALHALLPTNAFQAPWGGQLTVAAAASGFTITIPTPPDIICTQMVNRFAGNNRFTITAPCATFTYK